jgi:hypothetical protein
MKKYACKVERAQRQTVVVEAEHYEHAMEVAVEQFDEDKIYEEFIEAYDVFEISTYKEST